MKNKMGLMICPECWRATDEMVEFWGVDVDVIEELCRKAGEPRGIDPGHEFLQVFDQPREPKYREGGED